MDIDIDSAITIIIVLTVVAFCIYAVWKNTGFDFITEMINSVSASAGQAVAVAKQR